MAKTSKDTFAEDKQSARSIGKYEKALAIDGDDLDTGLIRQPQLLYDVCEEQAFAEAERDAIKLELDEAMADADNKIRALAEKNEEKVTEPFIKKQVQGDKQVMSLNKALLDAKLMAARWAALAMGFQARGRALSKLADLTISRVPGVGGSARSRLVDQTIDEVQESRRQRARERG
jgi:hypothetical protein